jgi:hypothetical protein
VSDALNHSNHVNTWMTREAKGLSSDQLAQLFERASGALWQRAYFTLGDLTLTAIVDRVLHNATEKFPVFGSLKLDGNGITYAGFRESASGVSKRELANAIQFILVELLTVIGNLTAEILTPFLHSELSKITLNDSAGKPRGGAKL